ncbi:hypothetical protein EBU91_00065 [bacterium]|nr:hypothetical protein [bacterium]
MTTFYKKVGRRYVAVSEYDSELRDAFQEGAHLVIVKPGGKSIHYNIDVNHVALIAAGLVAKEAMATALINASHSKPKKQPLTAEQATAWENLKKAFGDEMFSLYTESANTICEAGIKALIDEANKLLDNPSVKNAYDQFLLISKLTKDG